MPTAEPLTPRTAEHAEGPVWDAEHGQLLCVDLEVGDLLAVDPATGAVRRTHVADALAALRPRTAGGWVAGVQRRFAVWDDVEALLAGDEQARMLDALWPGSRVRFNDGACDPQGRFWCGSMAYDQAEGAAAMWRLDADGRAHAVMAGLTVSNGLHWSPDGARAYYVDSPTLRVDVLHVDPASGLLLGREPFATVTDGPGVPDGLVVDADGGVWVAVNGEGRVVRYDADGSLTEQVDVPVPAVTACTLGGRGAGEDGTEAAGGRAVLYLTTSTEGVDLDAHPGSGGVFRHEAGVAALAPLPYAG